MPSTTTSMNHSHGSRVPLPAHFTSTDNGIRDRFRAGPNKFPSGSRPRSSKPLMDPTREADASAVPGDADEDPTIARFKKIYAESETRIAALFGPASSVLGKHGRTDDSEVANDGDGDGAGAHDGSPKDAPPRKAARTIDEDDYDDYDADADEAEDGGDKEKLSQEKTGEVVPAAASSRTLSQSSGQKDAPAALPATVSAAQTKSTEEVREKLQEDKKAAEEAAKRSFGTLFYTIENDRDAMLEQQKLDELDRQVDAEMSGQGAHASPANNAATAAAQHHGKLSNANLGASSLTLKHLIARIDAKRNQVRASDAELRSLMSEVRKNRSKWANEERVGQEELYEAAEKVLGELKAMTEHSQPFLTRVNKRDAPDYYNIIKQPMDLGTMTKKLRSLSYKSKRDFVDDLSIIWANCLKYNADPNHYLRKHALSMRRETDKLVPLIPDIVVRDRAEVEAEERRMQNGGLDGEVEGAEESDDEPIMSSRGRKAPSKKAKKGSNTVRKAPSAAAEASSASDLKSSGQRLNPGNSSSNLKNELRRGESDLLLGDGSANRLSTPPTNGQGGFLPSINGFFPGGGAHPASQADSAEMDGAAPTMMNGLMVPSGPPAPSEEEVYEDLDYKTWKQVTKRDRALVAAERHRLFKGHRINKEEPALVRSKARMRRWLRQHRHALSLNCGVEYEDCDVVKESGDSVPAGETLAEGIEEEQDRLLPDYYDVMSGVPEIPRHLQWLEDADGQLRHHSEHTLKVVPKGHFTAPASALSQRIDANIRKMQETRKLCSKISIIKQMQQQTQVYQNQFQKYNPEPFVEKDIEPTIMSDDGPIAAPGVCRAALQRSVGKILYHTGFEEFQPSALDTITDIASDFFSRLVRTIGDYRDVPKVPVPPAADGTRPDGPKWQPRYTTEEGVLHALYENGVDIESVEAHAKDDIERLSSKLGVMHERMKAHLTDLLRPALAGGAEGADAFKDGSDQFLAGDFAEDIDEDFFGFKELGLDQEFGLGSLGVPLHLLQNRMNQAYQTQNTSATTAASSTLPPVAPYDPVTLPSVKSQIGLVQNFFLAKLHANGDEPLIEDDDLPQKQRFPKPRLPPTGKITSPRKRPLKEQGGGNKSKKKKIDPKKEGDLSSIPVIPPPTGAGANDKSPFSKGPSKSAAAGKLKLTVPGSSGAGGTNAEAATSAGAGAGAGAPASTSATATTDRAAADGVLRQETSPTIQHLQAMDNARAVKGNLADAPGEGEDMMMVVTGKTDVTAGGRTLGGGGDDKDDDVGGDGGADGTNVLDMPASSSGDAAGRIGSISGGGTTGGGAAL